MSSLRKNAFYISFSATDSKEFPLNKPSEFTVLLPQRIPVTGKWVCGLADSYLEGVGIEYNHLSVCCDIVQESIVYGQSLPILREIFLKVQRNDTTHSPIRYQALNTQELYLIKFRVIGSVTERVRLAKFVVHFKPVYDG